jgi:hypothetical protein
VAATVPFARAGHGARGIGRGWAARPAGLRGQLDREGGGHASLGGRLGRGARAEPQGSWLGHGGEPAQGRGVLFSFFCQFSYLALNSIPRMLFTNHSTSSKKIMVRHDATTDENISRVYSHKVSS